MKFLTTILLSLLFFIAAAQDADFDPRTGAKIGVVLQFGTQVNRLGLEVLGYHARDYAQINGGIRWIYNLRTWGPKKARQEWQIHLGALVAAGYRDTIDNPFLHPVSNQTGRKYSLGYAYQWYVEKLTPQNSGTLGLQFGRFEIIAENDALAGVGKDRFRTGTLQLAFRQFNSRYSLNAILWTGDTHGSLGCRIREPDDYPCRFGYKEISANHCGRFSHGVLAAGYQHYLGYGQMTAARLGIDSEKVRHILQNKLIHDMPFIPEKWNKAHNPHLPMLDENGEPYLFYPDQKIRPARFFFDLGLNTEGFY